MWHHGFATIVNMTTYSILCKYIIIIEFILIYLNDLKFKTQKYHLIVQLIVANINSISNDDDMACHMSTRCYN
jgi:hypothetical protein